MRDPISENVSIVSCFEERNYAPSGHIAPHPSQSPSYKSDATSPSHSRTHLSSRNFCSGGINTAVTNDNWSLTRREIRDYICRAGSKLRSMLSREKKQVTDLSFNLQRKGTGCKLATRRENNLAFQVHLLHSAHESAVPLRFVLWTSGDTERLLSAEAMNLIREKK